MSLEASRIALKKAQNPKVKEFAQLEVAEQETIADVLKSMRDQSTPASGQVKAPSAEVVQTNLDAKGKQMMEKLQKAEAGAGFDKEYIQGQIQGHQELLQIQETYLKSGKDRENLNVTKLMRGQIKEHLQKPAHTRSSWLLAEPACACHPRLSDGWHASKVKVNYAAVPIRGPARTGQSLRSSAACVG